MPSNESKDRMNEFGIKVDDLYDILDEAEKEKDMKALRDFESSINNLYLDIVQSAYRIEGK